MLNSESNLNKIAKKLYLNEDCVEIDSESCITFFNDKKIGLSDKLYKNPFEKCDVIIYNHMVPLPEVKYIFNQYMLKNKKLKHIKQIFIFTNNELSYYDDPKMKKVLLYSIDAGMDHEEKTSVDYDSANFYFLDKLENKNNTASQYFFKSRIDGVNIIELLDKKMRYSVFWVDENVYSELDRDPDNYMYNDKFRVLIQTEGVCLTQSQEKYFKKKGFEPLKIKDMDSIDFPLIDLFLALKDKKFKPFFAFDKEEIVEYDGSLFAFLFNSKENKVINEKMLERYEKIIIKKYGKDYQKRYEQMKKRLERARISNIRLEKNCNVLKDLGIVNMSTENN